MKTMGLKNIKMLKTNILSMIHTRQEEIKALQKQYNEIEQFIDCYPHSLVENGDKQVQKENKKKTKPNSNKENVASAAYKLVKMRGEPIKRNDLYDLLIEQGLVIDGKNPQMILSTMLWRVKDSGLIRLNGGGYWLKNEKYAPANYLPETNAYKSGSSNQMDLINHITH